MNRYRYELHLDPNDDKLTLRTLINNTIPEGSKSRIIKVIVVLEESSLKNSENNACV